jgi:hypothetical protein
MFSFFGFQAFCFMFVLSFYRVLSFVVFLGYLGAWPRQENLPKPLLKLSNPNLESFKKGQGKCFYIRPPTLDVKSWRPSANVFASAPLQASELGAYKL